MQKEFPGLRGFSVQNLWYMRQFYSTYKDNQKLQLLVGEISWSHILLIILCRTKDRITVEYALRESNKPIGIGTYRIVTRLPEGLAGQLPSPEQIVRLLTGIDEEKQED